LKENISDASKRLEGLLITQINSNHVVLNGHTLTSGQVATVIAALETLVAVLTEWGTPDDSAAKTYLKHLNEIRKLYSL
jgi:hypothetical protein